MFQGVFLAPQMVGEARKGGYLTAQLLAREGFDVRPPTGDCVTAVALRSRDLLLRFCKALMSHRCDSHTPRTDRARCPGSTYDDLSPNAVASSHQHPRLAVLARPEGSRRIVRKGPEGS